MVILYHNDPDGKCAAAIVNYRFREETNQRLLFIDMDYDKNVPFDNINKNEVVYIVDFSLQKPGDWNKLFEITPYVVWIDHHKSAIEAHQDLNDVEGIRDTSKSGCELTWEYLFPGEHVPLIVQHIGDYDTWKFNLSYTEEVFIAIKTQDINPESDIWEEWLNPSGTAQDEQWMVDELKNQGEIIQPALYNRYNEIVRGLSYEIEWEGFKCIACNATYVGSKLYNGINRSKYDFLIVYRHSKDTFTISLYTEKDHLDASEVCKRFGGGGHKGAAGFQCKQLPWITK